MGNKPGVMIYFEIVPVLQMLTLEEQGALFGAILEYGMDRKSPDLPEKLQVVWPLVQQRLDYDDMRYDRIVVRNNYAAYVRWAKEKGEPALEFEQWKRKNGYQIRDMDPEVAIECYPLP